MRIITRAARLIRSVINGLLGRAENPEKMLDQLILDMRDQLVKAKREVAGAIADERKLRAQAEGEVKQARDWERRAILAVREERDDLAKQALLRQKEHAERAVELRQTWESQASEVEKLRASLKGLGERIEEAGRRRNLLVAKQKRVQAQKRIQETISELSDDSAFGAFDRMAERIEEEERRTLAVGEVSEALDGGSLEEEFSRIESGEEVGDRLLALKREMGIVPPAPTGKEAPPQLPAGEAKPTSAPLAEEVEIAEEELLEEFDRLGKGRGD